MNTGTSKWEIVGDLLISVSGPGVLNDTQYQRFMQDLRKDHVKKYFAASLGKPEATSLQRKQLADVLKARGIRTASVTDDAVTRGLVTAVSWLGANIKAFAWSDTNMAMQYLEIPQPFAAMGLDVLAKLRKDVEAELR